MRAFFLFKFAKAFKYEIILIGSFMILLTIFPIAVILALANGSNFSPTTNGLYLGPPDPQDTYAYGNCTWWAYYARQQINQVIPTTWGNANTWAIRAQADGYVVDDTPSYGAIMQTTFGKLGHVAFVTAVDSTTGAWTISEMNVVGWDVVDTQTLTAKQATLYIFIHQPANQPSISLP